MPYREGAFVIAFSTLIIPAFDVIRVILVRIRSGKSPFEADKNHIHHNFWQGVYSSESNDYYLNYFLYI